MACQQSEGEQRRELVERALRNDEIHELETSCRYWARHASALEQKLSVESIRLCEAQAELRELRSLLEAVEAQGGQISALLRATTVCGDRGGLRDKAHLLTESLDDRRMAIALLPPEQQMGDSFANSTNDVIRQPAHSVEPALFDSNCNHGLGSSVFDQTTTSRPPSAAGSGPNSPILSPLFPCENTGYDGYDTYEAYEPFKGGFVKEPADSRLDSRVQQTWETEAFLPDTGLQAADDTACNNDDDAGEAAQDLLSWLQQRQRSISVTVVAAAERLLPTHGAGASASECRPHIELAYSSTTAPAAEPCNFLSPTNVDDEQGILVQRHGPAHLYGESEPSTDGPSTALANVAHETSFMPASEQDQSQPLPEPLRLKQHAVRQYNPKAADAYGAGIDAAASLFHGLGLAKFLAD